LVRIYLRDGVLGAADLELAVAYGVGGRVSLGILHRVAAQLQTHHLFRACPRTHTHTHTHTCTVDKHMHMHIHMHTHAHTCTHERTKRGARQPSSLKRNGFRFFVCDEIPALH